MAVAFAGTALLILLQGAVLIVIASTQSGELGASSILAEGLSDEVGAGSLE